MKLTGSVSVSKIAIQPDGKVIACGMFSTVTDQQACGVARLNVSNPASDDDGDKLGLAWEFAYDLNPNVSVFLQIQAPVNGVARLKPPTHRGLWPTGFFSPTMKSWTQVPIDAAWTIHPPPGSGADVGFFRFGLVPTASP